jgi:hypothetical protein
MTRKLVTIGFVAAAAAILGTWFVLPALGFNREEAPGVLMWPIYIRVTIVSVAMWIGIGSLFIRKAAGLWAGVVAGVMSPVAGVILVNPVLIFALGKAPLRFLVVGLTTGWLVWRIASSESRWFGEAA